MEKLTKPQQRALEKLHPVDWQSAYNLKESLPTLNALVRKGLAESQMGLGYLFLPRTEIKFRQKTVPQGFRSVQNRNQFLREHPELED